MSAAEVIAKPVPEPASEVRKGRERWAQLGGAAVDVGAGERGYNGEGEQGDRIDAIETVANILHWLDLGGVEEPEWVLVFARRHFNAERRLAEESRDGR